MFSQTIFDLFTRSAIKGQVRTNAITLKTHHNNNRGPIRRQMRQVEHFTRLEELRPLETQLRDHYVNRQTVLQLCGRFQDYVVARRSERVTVRVLEEYLLHCAYSLVNNTKY